MAATIKVQYDGWYCLRLTLHMTANKSQLTPTDSCDVVTQIAHHAVYTKLYAKCDQLVTVIGQPLTPFHGQVLSLCL